MKLPFLLAAALGVGGYAITRSLVKPPPSPTSAATAASTPDQNAGPSAAPAPGSSPGAASPARPKGPRPTFEQLIQAPPDQRLDLVILWLPDAPAVEVEALTNAWGETIGSTEGLWEALVSRWVAVDPAAALAHAREHSLKALPKSFANRPANRGTYHVRSVPAYKAYLQLNLEDALTRLADEPVPLLGQLLQQLLFSVEEPRRLAWAAAHAALPDSRLWVPKPQPVTITRPGRPLHGFSTKGEAIKFKLANTDLAGGRKDIDALPQNHERALLEMEYVGALAKKSPAEALEWSKTNLTGLLRMQAIALSAKEFSKTDPAKALAILKENKVRDLGQTIVGTVSISTAQGSTTHYRGNDRDGLQATLKATAAVDPRGTMDFLRSAGGVLPRDMTYRYVDDEDQRNNGSLARAIYKDWAGRDPKSAALWLASQSPNAGMDELTPLVSSRLAAEKSAESRTFITTLPDSPIRQKLVAGVAAEWALEDGPTALNWAATHGGESGLTQAFRQMSDRDALAASRQFSLLPPEVQSSQLQDLTNALGNQKPLSLPEFHSQLPPDQGAAIDLRPAITAFAEHNSREASVWVNQLPDNKARDSAISGLVDYLIGGSNPDMEAAAHWAAASSDPEAQARRLQRVAKAWNKSNPAGAAAAINNSQLSAPIRQQLLQNLQPAKP